MKKMLFILLFMILISTVLVIASSAEGYGVSDGLGILSQREKAEIESIFKSSYEELGIGFYMSICSYSNIDVDKAIVMDISEYYGRFGVSVYTHGAVSHKIDTEALQLSVSYNVAMRNFIESAKSITAKASSLYSYQNIQGFLLVFLIPIFITIIIFVIVVVVSYKKKLRGSIYPLDKFTTFELTDYSDIYTHSHTTRYKYRDSSKK